MIEVLTASVSAIVRYLDGVRLCLVSGFYGILGGVLFGVTKEP